VLDDFEELSGWTAIASEGTRVSITHEPGQNGMAMRIAFELNTGGGWAIVRKSFSLALPANYAFNFQLRGEGRPNNFEFKLVDAKGRNVWWRNQRDMVFPREWQGMTIRKSRLEYAWGPGSGAELKQVGAIEFAISGGEGGSGSVWLDDLTFAEREPAAHDPVTPEVQASSALPGFEPAFVLDQDPQTRWRSEPLPREQSVTLDFVRNHEYGGLVIDWDRDDYATAFEVETSSDGERWASAYRTTTGHGGRDYVYMPDAESRFVRIELTRSSRGRGYGIATIVVKPFEFSASPDRFFEAIARDSAPGTYPKYFTGRQTYWTIVGVDGDDHEALLNEEGLLEVDKGAFSIEPFLYTDAGFITWDAVTTTQTLENGYLPIPTVTWKHDKLTLAVTAVAIFGTMSADFLNKNLGMSLWESTVLLLVLQAAVFYAWWKTEGTLDVHSITTTRREIFYWLTVYLTFSLGTAAGDFVSGTLGFGTLDSTLIFLGLILVPLIGWKYLHLNSVLAFWLAYTITRPLGASFGDWLAVPAPYGDGLQIGTGPISLYSGIVLLAVIGLIAYQYRRQEARSAELAPVATVG